MNYKILASPASINDATDYYIGLIEAGIKAKGGTVKRVNSINEINKGDIIVTIEAMYFLRAILKKPFHKKINWFQGIVPEENDLLGGSWVRKQAWTLAEYLTLHTAILNIMVSEAMLTHFRKKYRYRKNNYLIIPCYNKQLNQAAFETKGKFENPNFVYAGSMAAWQGIDKTLMVFKAIELQNKNATLTLLTGQQEEARKLVQQYGINNVEIRYCKLDELDKELLQYKYGFLLRDNHVVNRVATPTKMNTYLSAGIIPVYTDVVNSFEQNINLKSYSLKFHPESTPEQMAVKILAFEKENEIKAGDILQLYTRIFAEYYNDKLYLEHIKMLLQ